MGCTLKNNEVQHRPRTCVQGSDATEWEELAGEEQQGFLRVFDASSKNELKLVWICLDTGSTVQVCFLVRLAPNADCKLFDMIFTLPGSSFSEIGPCWTLVRQKMKGSPCVVYSGL